MYLPNHFEETRVEVLHQLIVAHPLGALVVVTAGGLDANHVPFEVDPEPAPFGTLRAHIARANPLWRDTPRDADVLVIFQGPSTYISPAWYPTKRETGRVVPTWNYAVVHARGPLRFIDDRAWLRHFVEMLTNRHEAARHEPWQVNDAPAEYIETQLGAIIGLEIPVRRLVGKWKTSQNRSAEDRAGVSDGLAREGDQAGQAMARLVRESKKD
jgi:transcriptional regulator